MRRRRILRARTVLKFLMLAVIVVAGIVWSADWLLLRHKDRNGFGQVRVHHHYAVKLKNRRIEERSEPPHMEECVRSLFPHDGDNPCWYVERHKDDEEQIDSGPWHFYNQ